MVKVLFVCTGNICRSPTAHGLMRSRIERAGLGGRMAADSAGTHGYHAGDPPDPRAIATARRHGIDIADLRARKVSLADFSDFDLILDLDRGHEGLLLGLAPPGLEHKVRLLMRYAPQGSGSDVPDPYYDDKLFEPVFRLIEQAVDGLFDHLGG